MNLRRLLPAACAVVLFARPVAAEPAAVPLTEYAGVSMSPDGRYVADVEDVQPADESRDPAKHLIIREVASGASREIALPCAAVDGCTATVPAWSHDSKTIAYVVHAPKSATRDLFVAAGSTDPASPAPRHVLAFTGTLGTPKFSPDDARLATLAVANARKEVGATQAGAAIVGEIGTSPDEQRIAIVRLADASLAFASPPDLFVYEFDWLPSGTGFVGTAAPGDGDDNWWVARLFRFDAAAQTAQELYRPASAQQQLAAPRVSPDGRYVAFIGGIMSDFGSTGGDLYALALDRANATPVNLTPKNPASVTSFAWQCRADDLLATQLHGANVEVVALDVARPGELRALDAEPVSLGASDGSAVARSCENAQAPSRLAAIGQTFERAPEIATRPAESGAAWTPLTHANEAIPSEARARSVAWTNQGFSVQGWLLEPPAASAAVREPLVVSVHGGPAAANEPRFVGRGTTRDLLRHGYALFFPNPRGSFGQGEAFTLANVKDFGYGDLRDILAGVDALEKADPAIDDARLGITGGSYGGFMTMWAVTQTHRFKAAVAGAGLADWISYYGENGIDEWMIPYFGASAYDDPAVYRKSSPIEFIKNVTTPTFAYVGERDVECPAPQSQEFWHALVARGVPASLVIYAGEGHGIRNPKDRADVVKRTIAWFDRYLGSTTVR